MSPVTKTDLVRQVQQELSLFSGQVSLQDSDFTLLAEDETGIALSGTASLFSLQGVKLTIKGTTQGAEVAANFSGGLTEHIIVGGKPVQTWIPGWLAGKMDLQDLQLGYQISPATAKLGLTLGEIEGAPLVELQGFKASQPALTITLEQSASALLASAAITGNLDFGSTLLSLDCTADSTGHWDFKAAADTLKLSGLVQDVANAAQLSVPPLPDEFNRLDIRQAQFAFNSERQVDIVGQWPWGTLEGYFQKGSQVLLAFSPDNSFRFAYIADALAVLDKVTFKDAGILYCNAAIPPGSSAQVFKQLDLSAQTVPAGLTVVGTYAIPQDLPGLNSVGATVVLMANIPKTITPPLLRASVAFKGLDFGPDFSLLETFIQLVPSDLSFGAGLRFKARLDSSDLYFSGLGEIAAPATFGVVAYMEDGSVWKNPFGLPGLEIGELGLDVGADVLSPAPRPKLGIRGKLRVGPVEGEGAGMLNTANPLESLISAKLNELSFQQCVDAFLQDNAKSLVNQLPSAVRTLALKNAELTIVPKAQLMAGRHYDAGLRVKGDGTIAYVSASLDVNITYTGGISGMASVSPIILKQGNVVVFRLSGNRETDPALMSVDMTVGNLLLGSQPFLRIDGYVALLGLVSNSRVDISKKGFYLYTHGKIFAKFDADFDLRGGNLQDAAGMSVRAALKNDLTAYLRGELEKLINADTQTDQLNYKKAKEDLQKAQDYLRTSQAAVDAFNRAQNDVNSKKGEVDRLRQKADQTKRQLDSLGRFDPRKLTLGTQWAAEKGAAETAAVGLAGAVKALEGLKAAVDWGQREAATKAVGLASATISEIEKSGLNPKKAAKWIVDKGLGGIVEVKSAEFEGTLLAVSGGKVALQVNVSFLGVAYNAGLDFEFSNPAASAQALAKSLLANTALAGSRASLAGLIGKGWG